MNTFFPKTVAIIVAHPDDETLWAGSTIIEHPLWQWYVICLSRKNDTDRAPKFYSAMKLYNAIGRMGDMDDGPEQTPLSDYIVQKNILDLLPNISFDLVLTHNPSGEYNRHLRHEETSKAVIKLWHAQKIMTKELWTFAYSQDAEHPYPQPNQQASIFTTSSIIVWAKKFNILRVIYGFNHDSFEAKTNPRSESFWKFTEASSAIKWLNKGGVE